MAVTLTQDQRSLQNKLIKKYNFIQTFFYKCNLWHVWLLRYSDESNYVTRLDINDILYKFTDKQYIYLYIKLLKRVLHAIFSCTINFD